MTVFRSADHAMGLELQIEELSEQRERARVQHRQEDVDRLDAEITALQDDLAATAERLAVAGEPPVPEPELHNAEELAGQ